MKLTNKQVETLNASIDKYMDTLRKINDVLNDESFEYLDKKALVDALEKAIFNVYEDWK